MKDEFEETLSQLKRKPLPPEWRDELVSRAVSEAEDEDPVIPTGIFNKLAIGAIAACWAGALLFHLATPASANSTELAKRFDTTPEYLPLLARQFTLVPSAFSRLELDNE